MGIEPPLAAQKTSKPARWVISFRLAVPANGSMFSWSSSTAAADLSVAVTAHPSAAWTLQQLREVVGFDHARRFLIHDRDSIFARSLDESIRNPGLTVLKSPPHSPKANAICERVIGTIRRECLDWLIPLSESHLRSILRSWVGHYNHGRRHMVLGPGVPDPPSEVVPSAAPLTRHRIGERLAVRARSVLGGLHHEYLLAPASA
jgi:putative transposase